MNKSKNFLIFQLVVGSRSGSGIKMGNRIRIRIGIKTMRIHFMVYDLAYLSVEAANVEEDGGLLEGHGSLAAGHAGQTVVPAQGIFLKIIDIVEKPAETLRLASV